MIKVAPVPLVMIQSSHDEQVGLDEARRLFAAAQGPKRFELTPVPLAEIHSTNDEFSPVAAAQAMLQKANPLKRLWVVQATDHRFSGNLVEFDRRLVEAIEWVKQNKPR